MAEWLRTLRAGAQYFSSSVQGRVVYAMNFLSDIVAVSFGFAIILFLWANIAPASGGPIAKADLYNYLAFASIINFANGFWIESIVGDRVRSGLIAIDLLRPINFQILYFSSSLADVAVQSVMALPLIGLALWALPAPPAWDSLRILYFALSLALAVGVQYGIGFCFAQATFVTHNGFGVFATRMSSHYGLSGIFAPLVLMPAWLQQVVAFTPFHCVIHTPTVILCGLVEPGRIPLLLAEQAAWALGLTLAGHIIFKQVAASLEVQGG